MKKSQFKPGDILASRSNSFLSKAIRTMMHWYKDYADGYSHNAVIINGGLVAEALAGGVKVHSLEESGYLNNNNVAILRHKNGFTKSQLGRVTNKMLLLEGTRYQYGNLPLWVAKILFHIDKFKGKSEKAIYCSELAAIAINTAYPGTFPEPNKVSPADHICNPIYETIKS